MAGGAPLRLTPAAPDDWPRAWALQREAFAALVERTHGGWTAALEAECAAAWAPAHTRLLWVGDELAGWLRLRPHPDHDWLDLLVLGADWRGRGLGTAVLTGLQADAAARGVPLWLSVVRANAARRLYARLGFVEVPRDDRRVFMAWAAPGVPVGRPPGR